MDYTPVSLVARPYYGTPKTIGLFSNHTFLWKNDDTLIDDNFFLFGYLVGRNNLIKLTWLFFKARRFLKPPLCIQSILVKIQF